MSIRIDEINVENLGPISKLSLGLKDINLIYGKNERGKTFLVDFLLKSLFLSAPRSKRLISGTGLVKVSGLQESILSFSPGGKEKLEHHLADAQNMQLPNLYKLLVIRGGELALVEGDPSGVNKQILKEYLSNQKLLDVISDSISTAVKDMVLEKGNIIGKNAGEIRKQNDLQSELKELDRLLESVNNNLSAGPHNKIEKELYELQNEAKDLYIAKCHLAFSTAQEIAKCDSELKKLPVEEVANLKILIRDYSNIATSIEKSKALIKEKTIHHQNYLWLDEAIKIYQALGGGKLKKPIWILVGLSALFFIFSIVFNFLKYPLFVLLFILLGVISAGVFIYSLYGYTKNFKESEEIQKITNEFIKRFDENLASLALMQAVLKKIEPDYYEYQRLLDEVKEKSKDLESKETEIQNEFVTLSGKKAKQSEWQEKYQKLKDRLEDLDAHRQKLENLLSSLNVSEDEFDEESVGANFDVKRESELFFLIEKNKNDLRDEDQKLLNLQYEIQTFTHSSSSVWNDLIHELEIKRRRNIEDLQNTRAKIIGGNLVYQVIRDLRLQEDDAIRRNLNSEKMLLPMKKITHRYEKIEIDNDDNIIVSDPFNQFNMFDLSTGAQEQILLALRIGFASILLGKEKPFMILDDAFQHSDWDRREYLIDTVMDLAKEGCQIIYLSMDDHIRELFLTKMKNKFQDKYVYYELVK